MDVGSNHPGSGTAKGLRLVGHSTLGGHGDGSQVVVVGDIAYVAHMGMSRVGTSIVDVSDPSEPRLLSQVETPLGTHSHKVQVVGETMLVNYERNKLEDPAKWDAGLKVFDVSRPDAPREVSFLRMAGKGVHRMTYFEGPYAYMSGSDEGYVDQFFMIVDLSRPSAPREMGRWWLPGMRTGAGEEPSWPETARFAHHHPLIRKNFAYCTWWDGGLVVLDISDIEQPRMVNHLLLDGYYSRSTHTALPVPGRDLLILVNEGIPRVPEDARCVRVMSIADPANPEYISTFPVPPNPVGDDAAWFGPHNLHEMRPGSLVDEDHVYMTYFAAGVRVVDIRDPAHPIESAHFLPEPPEGQPYIQMNDLTVGENGLIYATDRISGGLYVLSTNP